ncbi:uncharacterized protein LOC143901933 [Temnothorax americanus]|uniref:uncharacterized protein LOC143901933 n=1 Tax=Temnothorax americanus TaxID=1964332 RepID=UPI004067C6B0
MYRCIPASVCNSFFNRQEWSLHSFCESSKNRINKKFEFLYFKHMNQRKNIRPIEYFCNISSEHRVLDNNNVTYSLVPFFNRSGQKIAINIDPKSFTTPIPSLMQLNDGWFVNLSSTDIPTDIQGLLQLGENFSLPGLKKDKVTIEFIKNIENNIKKFPIRTHTTLRNRFSNMVNSLRGYEVQESAHDNAMKHLSIATKNFMDDNSNLILTRADKGNVAVAMDKDKYIASMEELLGDTDTYKIVSRDPIRKVTTRVRELLTRWRKSEFISDSLYRWLYCSDGILPREYGLPKIHKINCPLRIIVSCVDSPLYNLAAFLHKVMFNSFPKGDSQVSNSFDLVKKLSETHIREDYTLMSLDVISLFTNVPTEMVIDSIAKRWNYISESCSIPESEFLQAVRLVLESTFFVFNGVIYQQTFGSPMGSPLSPIGADIVMQDLEVRALGSLKFAPSFYKRYVDDIAMAVPLNECTHVLETFNSFHPRLQFTMEIGVGGKLNFLEVTMFHIGEHLQFDWFHKPTFSGRYLNFLSQHPLCQKKGTVIGLIDRVFMLSHPRFYKKKHKIFYPNSDK